MVQFLTRCKKGVKMDKRKNKVINRRKKGSGSLVAIRGKWACRWFDGGKLRQEVTPYRVEVKADRARAEAVLAEKTKLGQLKSRRDQVAILIAEREELEAKIRRLEAQAAPPGARLSELVELWRRSPRRRDCSAGMMAQYERHIRAFVVWAGDDMEIRAVDDSMAEAYAAHLAAGASPNTYNKYINSLDAAWRAVGRSVGAKGNPWAEMPRKRLETHVQRALTVDETDKILEVATGEVRKIIAIGLFTGLRLGDACRLKWSAVVGGRVKVKTAKTGAVVAIPAHARLVEILGEPGDAAEFVTPEMAATYKCKGRVSKLVRRAFEAAGIESSEKRDGWHRARPTASFHSLRHTFVSRSIEAGVAPAIVQALVGHSSAAMTEHYTHVSAEAMEEAFRRLG